MLLLSGVYIADTLTGEIRGEVLDSATMLVLPDVAVTLRNVDRQWQRPATTDADGNYIFIQLEPGNYALTFAKENYYTKTETDILVPLNKPKVVRPPVQLTRLVTTATQTMNLATPEGVRVAVVDATAAVPANAVITYIQERGYTALATVDDSALRWNYDTTVVHALPLRGNRTFDQLALFAPGVLRVPSSSGEGPAVGIGVGTAGQFAVNGIRGRSNNFTVDGSDNNDEDIGVRRQGFVTLTPQSIESVQEFQVLTAGFPAEFGRNAGSMVNAVSRSGQCGSSGGDAVAPCEHHGSLYGLWNHDALNTRGFFDRPFSDRANTGINNGGAFAGEDQTFGQFGGVAGGSILPRRLYYFGSAEHQRGHTEAIRHFVVPAPAERGLHVRERSYPGGFVPIGELGTFFDDRGTNYSNQAGKGIFDLYPLPNDPEGPFGPHTYSQTKRGESSGTGFSMKTDWYPLENHSFAARYNFTDDRSILPFTSEAIHSTLANRTRTQNLSMFLNSRISQLGSALRVSYGRTRLAFPVDGSSPFVFGSAPAPGISAVPIQTPYGRYGPFGATGPIGQLAIVPYSPIGIDVFNFPQGRVDNTFQIAEAVTWTRSRHTLRGGIDWRRTQLNSFSDRNSRPLLLFGYGIVGSDCLNDFSCPYATNDGLLRGTDLAALGAPAGFLQALSTQPAADSTIGLRMGQIDFFVQHDWRVRPRFVLNLGLRYELQTITKETNRRIENTFALTPDKFSRLQPTGANAGIITAGNLAFDTAFNGLRSFLDGRDGIYAPDQNNLAPRAGFAWDPWGNGRTSIRAGYSLAYDANLGAVTSQSRNVFPTFVPINLDLNFLDGTGQSANGRFVGSPTFFGFRPANNSPLVRPGTLNTFNLSGAEFATALGGLFINARPSAGINLSSNGLAFTLPEKGLDTSYAQHWTMSVERAIGAHFMVSATYVGTRGLHLPRFTTPNAGLLSTPVLLASAIQPLTLLDLPPSTTPGSSSRPQRGLGAYTVFQNSASSSHHSLQLSVERRLNRGIQFRSNWTWGHIIDEVSDPFDGRGFSSLPQDVTQFSRERASANFDARHRFTSYAIWERGDAGPRALRRWRLAATTEFQTGQPFTVNTAVDRNLDGNLTDRLDRADGLRLVPGSAWPIRFDSQSPNLSSLIARQGSNGRVGRNTFRADGIATVDVALSRNITLAGSGVLDLRIEAFNVFNQTSFGIPVRILESPAFGRSYDTASGARSVRFYAKFSF